MFTRRTVVGAIVCALMTTAVAVSPARASQPSWTAAPQAEYYASLGQTKPDAGSADHGRYFPTRSAGAAKAAAPQAAYYASYGQPEPLTPAHQPAPGDDDTPWLPLALVAAAALAIGAGGATLASRMRRHAPRVAA
jgi:hypothetical protein